METNEDIYSYENIDLIDYLNTKHKTIDLIEIESEMNSKKGLLRRIDDNLYDFFNQSSNSLLSLLAIYKQCLEILKNFKTETNTHVETDEDLTLSEELVKKFKLFKDDMNLFLTEERYFVVSGVFNEDSIICILTNDLLFVGEKASGNRFELKRVVPKVSVEIKKQENALEIVLDNGTLSLKGDKNVIENFYESFQEISYVFNKKETPLSFEIDFPLLNFYVQTGCYDEMTEYFEVNELKNEKYAEVIANFLENIQINDEKCLECVMELSCKPLNICAKFFIKRLSENLEKINQIQQFESFVNDVFTLLENFCSNLKNFYKMNNLPVRSLILLMEECVATSIKFLERRLSIHSKIFGNKDMVKTISDRLVFQDCNFKYLADEIIDVPFVATERMMKEAKETISFNVEEFLSN